MKTRHHILAIALLAAISSTAKAEITIAVGSKEIPGEVSRG